MRVTIYTFICIQTTRTCFTERDLVEEKWELVLIHFSVRLRILALRRRLGECTLVMA